MKILRLSILTLLALSAAFLMQCKEDEEEVSLVNFNPEAYDLEVTDLSPVTVTLTLDPAASKASSITISFSGAEAGTVFTTSPALSGSTVIVPVAAGDQSVSFTVTLNQASLPAGDFVITMTMSEVGAGLNTGITTEAAINVANIELTSLPYIEDFDDACSGTSPAGLPPEGWRLENTEVNSAGTDGANTGSWMCTSFAVTGGGAYGNAFVGGSADPNTSETWLISPILGPIASSSTLTFEGDLRFNDLQAGFEWYDIVVSTDYNGLNFETAAWTRLDAAYNALAANNVGVDDAETYEDISLADYEGKGVAIAFIYRCSKPSNCAAMRVGYFEVSD